MKGGVPDHKQLLLTVPYLLFDNVLFILLVVLCLLFIHIHSRFTVLFIHSRINLSE